VVDDRHKTIHREAPEVGAADAGEIGRRDASAGVRGAAINRRCPVGLTSFAAGDESRDHWQARVNGDQQFTSTTTGM
jgi:hypothetical protein